MSKIIKVINVEKKINIFTVKLANNKKFIITVYDNDIIISTLINNIYNNSIFTINDSKYIDIVAIIHKKLFSNPIENKQFIRYNHHLQCCNICEFIFEVIPETIIIEENTINSIDKIINDTKLNITVFDDNIFITKTNYRSLTFYYDNYQDIFNTINISLSYARKYFSQTEKNILSKGDLALARILQI